MPHSKHNVQRHHTTRKNNKETHTCTCNIQGLRSTRSHYKEQRMKPTRTLYSATAHLTNALHLLEDFRLRILSSVAMTTLVTAVKRLIT